jgi:SAM-dependent methyltransferase
VERSYAERYRELFERHWWWRARERVIIRELDRYRPAGGWRRALDVGCGDGLFFGTLLRYAEEVEGIEPDENVVSAEARAAGQVHVRPFDATFRPGRPYDLVVFLDVLEHLDNAEATVSHTAALMETGGTLIVTVPAHRHLWTTHDELNRHVTRFSERELLTLLSSRFDVARTRHFFRWVHPVKLLQRGFESVTRPDPAPPTLPPAPVNAALYWLSRAEEALLRKVPLSLGSSLLAVATRR